MTAQLAQSHLCALCRAKEEKRERKRLTLLVVGRSGYEFSAEQEQVHIV